MVNRLLMCRPTHFGVDYNINPWMTNTIGTVDQSLANAQWETLYNALKSVADVALIDPVEGLPDMVFTANAGLAVGNVFFLSKFAHSERSSEERYFREWFLNRNFYSVEQLEHSFEGEGDCLRDHTGTHWMGRGFRTNESYLNCLTEFKVNAQAVELVDPRFYHIDTCFCPFPDGRLMYYPGAFSEDARNKIEKHFKEIIKVTEEEALTFCCNGVIIDKNIFMPECSSIANRLTDLGYMVQQFDMSEFLKSGGACKCLVMNI